MTGKLIQMTGPAMDLVYKVAQFPRSGQEAVVRGFALSPGGGFNAMVAARRAGMAVALGGGLGTGPLADTVAKALQHEGITLARPRLPEVDQGCCTVILEPDGERSFLAADGAEGRASAMSLAQISLEGVSWVMLSGYTLSYPLAGPALAPWLQALPPGVKLLFDPSPMVGALAKSVLAPVMARADWVSANDQEAAILTGQTDPSTALACLAAGREGALVRLGAKGALLSHGAQTQEIAPHRVAALDTNGAGDAHIGSFIALFEETGDAVRAARYANCAAALSTLQEGPACAPPRQVVEDLLR